MKPNLYVVLLIGVIAISITAPSAFGHGLGFEILPPQMMGDRKVAMEVKSTIDNATHRKQVTFSLFDTNSGLTVRDVTYNIKTIKSDKVLFEGTYQTKNGILTMDLIPNEENKVTVNEKKGVGPFDFLIGSEQSTVEAKGSIFDQGGLYRFSIDIVSAEKYSSKSQKPVKFESGISFPEAVFYEVNDHHYGTQVLKLVSYYDLFEEMGYNQQSKSVFFSMPFEWSKSNIGQTSVVHQEVFIPKTFGALQVSEYELSVNGFTIPVEALTIDDFPSEYRVIHILLYQSQLESLYDKQNNTQNKLNFLLIPKSNDLHLSTVTENVQYKIEVTTVPKQVVPGQQIDLLFKTTDVFLQGKVVSVNYDLVVRSDDGIVYQTSGTSTNSKDQWNKVSFALPKDVPKKLTISFENLGGNSLADAELPLLVSSDNLGTKIPSWIKNNAGWWCEKQISDDDFLRGIEYLIKNGMIDVDMRSTIGSEKEIPGWVRNTSCWWANDSISDSEFVSSIAYLVKNGIIKA